jgi:hypothetical protein
VIDWRAMGSARPTLREEIADTAFEFLRTAIA